MGFEACDADFENCFGDLELGELLDFLCEGEAWDIWDGNENGLNLESWRLLSKRFSPKGPARQLQDTRRLMKPVRAPNLSEALKAIQLWENQCTQHRSRHGSSPFDDDGLRKYTLLDILPAREADELEAQLHLFPKYSDLKTRVEEMVVTRSGRPATKSQLQTPNTRRRNTIEDHYRQAV